MKLTVIYNGLKRTMSANDVLGLLQMVSEPDTGWCASKDAGAKGGELRFQIGWRGEQNIPKGR